MKIGDVFSTIEKFEQALGCKFPRKGFLVGSFIESLPNHPDVSCARHIFYASNFWQKNKDGKITQKWWNEFDRVTHAEMCLHSADKNWLLDKTKVVHEILSPLLDPSNPGADPDVNKFHNQDIIDRGLTKRLILGNLNGKYVFLGLYELDVVASSAVPNNPYKVDSRAFPLPQFNPITYPHCIWKRIFEERVK